MKIFKVLTVASIAFGGNHLAQAEDDLMAILEGKNTASATQFVESEEILKIRKVVGNTTAEQNIFFQFLSEKKYEKALFQWNSAFGASSFAKSETGAALESFLYLKNGLKVTAVEGLFSIPNPQKIHDSVLSLWKENLTDNDPVWGMAHIQWSDAWTPVFGIKTEVAVTLQKNYVTEDIGKLMELIKKAPADSAERNTLEWQLVLNLGIKGDAGKAAQVLSHLMKAKNNPIDPDLMTLTAGRLLYQNGYLDAAVKYYQKISKKSDYWFQAQEEMAWAYMRKGEPQNAIAITRTLTYPHFKGWVGIESYLLGAFSSLKVCDYPEVLGVMKSIKGQFSEHLIALEKLSLDSRQPAVSRVVKALENGLLSTSVLGADAHVLPMDISKDETLSLLAKRSVYLAQEAQVAEQLYAKSLTFGNLQGHFEKLKNQIQTRSQLNEGASYQRVQELAKAELEDSKQVLQRLRIVEVEMIQQVDSSAKFLKSASAAETKSGTTGSSAKFAMNFSNDKEVWFDELSNFKVDIKKGCAQSSAKE